MARRQQNATKQERKTGLGKFFSRPYELIKTALAERKQGRTERNEALALLKQTKRSPLARRTTKNSSTTHLLAPPPPPPFPPPPPPAWARPPSPTIESASLVRIISHTSLDLLSSPPPLTTTSRRPPLISIPSAGTLTTTAAAGGPLRGILRGGNFSNTETRRGSVVSWCVPEGGGERDRGETLVKVRTKLFRQISWSSGEEDFEEIFLDEGGKKVVFVWGQGVDGVIE